MLYLYLTTLIHLLLDADAWTLVIPSSSSPLPHIHDHTTALDLRRRVAYTYGGYKGGGGYGPAFNSDKLYSFNIATGKSSYLNKYH